MCKSKQDEPDEQEGARESSRTAHHARHREGDWPTKRNNEREFGSNNKTKVISKACHPTEVTLLFEKMF